MIYYRHPVLLLFLSFRTISIRLQISCLCCCCDYFFHLLLLPVSPVEDDVPSFDPLEDPLFNIVMSLLTMRLYVCSQMDSGDICVVLTPATQAADQFLKIWLRTGAQTVRLSLPIGTLPITRSICLLIGTLPTFDRNGGTPHPRFIQLC